MNNELLDNLLSNHIDETITIEDLVEIGIAEVVDEPDYSRERLVEYENKYGLFSYDLYWLYLMGVATDVPIDEVRQWVFEYEVYIRNDGDPFEIHRKEKTEFDDGGGAPPFFV